MAEIIIRDNEGEEIPFALPWDTVFIGDPAASGGGAGDWKVTPDIELEPRNIGGLSAQDPLATAILLCLFTDRRKPDWMQSDIAGPRGWHGDTFDISEADHERPMGSLLWTLERAALDSDTERLAKYYAQEALQTLIDQGKVGSFDIITEMNKPAGQLLLQVRGYDPSGDLIFQNEFPLLT